MKINYHNILGKSIELNAHEALMLVASACSEGILCREFEDHDAKNIFDRRIFSSMHTDISFLNGISSTGLRVAGIITEAELIANAEQIRQAVRQHLPLVIFAEFKNCQQWNSLAQTGAIQLLAASVQETIDLSIMAFRIAELSLVPVIIGIEKDAHNATQKIIFPEKQALKDFLGNADEWIPSPIGAQQIVFGKNRRKVPKWFNTDSPLLLGARKENYEMALEAASQHLYFTEQADKIIVDVFKEYELFSGRKYQQIEEHKADVSEYLMIYPSSVQPQIEDAFQDITRQTKSKTGGISLRQTNPFPSDAIKKICKNKKAITILEQITDPFNIGSVYKEFVSIPELNNTTLFSGLYGTLPSVESISEAIMNMLPGGMKKTVFWLEVAYTRSKSEFPKHEVLLQAINREYPEAKDQTIGSKSKSTSRNASRPRSTMPASIERYTDKGPAFSRLSRFFDDTAYLFENAKDELVAHPFQAIPLIPPVTANFADLSIQRKALPSVDLKGCTGCGVCFIHCPHSAIPPIAISVEKLIKAGAEMVTGQGGQITQLTPLVKNLSKVSTKIIREKQGGINTISDFLTDSFEDLASQMNLDEAKKEMAQKDITAVENALSFFKVSINDTFYNIPETIEKGSGELFSLAIDPYACDGCGICESVCPESVIAMVPESEDHVNSLTSGFEAWEQLPDTAGYTITRLIEEKNYSSIAAILLSRNFYMSMNGGNKESKYSASKTMTHLAHAVAESVMQPRITGVIKNIDDLIKGLSERINSELAIGLPEDKYESILKILNQTKEDKEPFDKFIEKLGGEENLRLIDKKKLKRITSLAEDLKSFRWLLTEGPTGNGRSRLGTVLDSTLEWGSSYPWNNFSTPVFVDFSNTSIELARGIVLGNIRNILDNIKLLRRATAELKGKYDPDIHDAQLASLTWEDLSEEEKNSVPPVLIICKRGNLSTGSFDSLISLLSSGLPLKVMVLDDLVPKGQDSESFISSGMVGMLPLIACKKALIARIAISNDEHFFTSMLAAMHSNKPAMLWVLTPDSQRHDLSTQNTLWLDALAVNTRAFPLMKFDPRTKGEFISSKTSIEGNPSPETEWNTREVTYLEGDTEMRLSYSLTWADWAYTFKNKQDHFRNFSMAMGKPLPVAEYITLDEESRAGFVPVIYRIDESKNLISYTVSPAVIKSTEACMESWKVLNEISGSQAELPEKILSKIKGDADEAFEKQKKDLIREYEERIADLENKHLEIIRRKLKEKLVFLSEQAKEN